MAKAFHTLSDYRKKLRWQAWHRGMRELDLLVGPMVDEHIIHMDDVELKLLEEFLDVSDADMWKWIMEKEPLPLQYDNIIWQWLMDVRGEF